MHAFDRYRLRLTEASRPERASTVLIALGSNALVALAKTAAAILTGSQALAAEAVHSWVDTGNELFVIAASRTGRRPADAAHPLGYGRESFVWSLFASLGTLLLGSVVTIWRALGERAGDDGPGPSFLVGYLVIAISFVLEGYSFLQAFREVKEKARRRGRDVFTQALRTSDTALRAVFIEDLTALIALVLAAAGMALHQLTGRVIFDTVAAVLIGALMGAAALLLLNHNRRFLEGKALTADQRAEAIRLLKSFPEVARVSFLYAELIGPDRLMLVAGVTIAGEHTQTDLSYVLRRLEERIATHEAIGLVILTLATPDEEDAIA